MLPIIDSHQLSPLIRGLLNAVTFCLSLVLLERSADTFVDSTAIVAKRFGISTVLVGLLTAGAEWEELAVVVSSLGQHNPDLAISNILGSCTANILGSFSLGLIFARNGSLTISQQDKASSRIYSGILIVIGVFVILVGPGWGYLLGLFKQEVQHGSAGRWAGILLLVTFVVYVGGILYGIQQGNVIAPEGSDSDSDSDTTDDSSDEDEPSDEVAAAEQTPLLPRRIRKLPTTTFRHVFNLVISAALLTVSGILLSSTTSTLADLMRISQSTAGLTILSLATTLPEKLVAFKSGRKAQAGVLVANTVGSNVFLLTLVLGIVWVSKGHMPMAGSDWFWIDVGVVLASSVVLALLIRANKLKRWIGIVTFVVYILYIVSIFLR